MRRVPDFGQILQNMDKNKKHILLPERYTFLPVQALAYQDLIAQQKFNAPTFTPGIGPAPARSSGTPRPAIETLVLQALQERQTRRARRARLVVGRLVRLVRRLVARTRVTIRRVAHKLASSLLEVILCPVFRAPRRIRLIRV